MYLKLLICIILYYIYELNQRNQIISYSCNLAIYVVEIYSFICSFELLKIDVLGEKTSVVNEICATTKQQCLYQCQ